ncbi:HNH endonuclease [Marisediminitalea aggregata]|uniref:HNH endonuclease n=1 Tax=Marisediminitalea aggregata TaxID=634436 RepID=A0A1M5F9W4_9ALTE|nr:HNH endonuclease [Marisediminitalea aggregata]
MDCKKVKKQKADTCACCGRTTYLTFHHLIPRKMHRRPHFKKHYSKAELAAGVMVCRQCHNGIHKFYNEMVLAKQLNTLPLLLSDPTLSAHFAWVSRQKVRVCR